jgi:hypothetical protein
MHLWKKQGGRVYFWSKWIGFDYHTTGGYLLSACSLNTLVSIGRKKGIKARRKQLKQNAAGK